MISIRKISTKDTFFFDYNTKLLLSSFPKEERREIEEWRELTDLNHLFTNNIILKNNMPIGMITYWELRDIIFIEHFAIDSQLRNGGLGKQSINLLLKQSKKPIILEVDLPEDAIAKRRVEFYKRQGLLLWDKKYKQPPYRSSDNSVPMRLMSTIQTPTEESFEHFKEAIYQYVYAKK